MLEVCVKLFSVVVIYSHFPPVQVKLTFVLAIWCPRLVVISSYRRNSFTANFDFRKACSKKEKRPNILQKEVKTKQNLLPHFEFKIDIKLTFMALSVSILFAVLCALF